MLDNRYSQNRDIDEYDGFENRLPNENFPRAEKLLKPKETFKERKANFVTKSKIFFVEFFETTSVHGLVYLARLGLHYTERVLWLTCICIACYAITSLGMDTWERFQTNPMVISMDRNKFFWNTSFPSLTVCPHKRIDEMKLEDYMDAHPEYITSEEDREDFRVFITKLANISYENFEELPMNKTFGIPSSKYLDLLYEFRWNFQPEMSSGTSNKMYIDETITELGICYAVNSMISKYSSYLYWKKNMWNKVEHPDKVTVHPLDGEIYAQIINLSTSYDVYFHGAMEVADIARQRYSFAESDYTTVELVALEIFAKDEARDFTITQRKCRFPHESDDMIASPIYSYGLCHIECRMRLAMKTCNCVPHFYRSTLKGARVFPTCDFKGLRCLTTIKNEIISLQSETLKIDCNCYANCDDSNFFVQAYRSRIWFLGANLQWGINDYPKMQLRRDVLFGLADVLVYIGGLAGFFLGSSLLSFTEIIYFFTARLVRALTAK